MMRKTPLLACVFAGLLGATTLIAAETKKKSATTTPTTKPSTAAKDGPPVNKFCAVEGEDNKVDPAVFTIYKDKKIGFCCKGCIKDFNKDPEKYIKTMK